MEGKRLKRILICTIIGLQMVSLGAGQKAKVLSDKNFEHDTQATTGSTTGDWFVNFCDKNDKDCRNIEPLWDELAGSLRGRLSVATADRRGKFYEYEGDFEIEKLREFATDTYDGAIHQGAIPLEASGFQKLWKMMLDEIEENGGYLNTFLMKDEFGNVNLIAVSIVFGIPLMTFIGVCFLCTRGGDDVVESEIKRENEAKKKLKKKKLRINGVLEFTGCFSTGLILNAVIWPAGQYQIGKCKFARKYEEKLSKHIGQGQCVGPPQNKIKSKQQPTDSAPNNIGSRNIHSQQQLEGSSYSPSKLSGRRLSSVQSNERLNRSPMSNNSGGRRRSSSQRKRRSLSTDPDSQERAFVYPCQAFKQFLLSMKEGNINLDEIANQPQLAEYLRKSERQIDQKPFEQTLRGGSHSSKRSNSRPRNSKTGSIAKPSHANSIIEVDEEDYTNKHLQNSSKDLKKPRHVTRNSISTFKDRKRNEDFSTQQQCKKFNSSKKQPPQKPQSRIRDLRNESRGTSDADSMQKKQSPGQSPTKPVQRQRRNSHFTPFNKKAIREEIQGQDTSMRDIPGGDLPLIDLSKSWIPDSEKDQNNYMRGGLIKDDSIQQIDIPRKQLPKVWTPFERKVQPISPQKEVSSRGNNQDKKNKNTKFGKELIPFPPNCDGDSIFNDSINQRGSAINESLFRSRLPSICDNQSQYQHQFNINNFDLQKNLVNLSYERQTKAAQQRLRENQKRQEELEKKLKEKNERISQIIQERSPPNRKSSSKKFDKSPLSTVKKSPESKKGSVKEAKQKVQMDQEKFQREMSRALKSNLKTDETSPHKPQKKVRMSPTKDIKDTPPQRKPMKKIANPEVHNVQDKIPFIKAFDRQNTNMGKSSVDFNDRADMKSIEDRFDNDSLLAPSRYSYMKGDFDINQNPSLSQTFKTGVSRGPSLREILNQQRQSTIKYRDQDDQKEAGKELGEVLLRSIQKKIERDYQSPYKKDSLYDRQSLDRSLDKSFDKSFESSQLGEGLQVFQVKKKYGAVSSGFRTSPIRQVVDEDPEDQKSENKATFRAIAPIKQDSGGNLLSGGEGKPRRLKKERSSGLQADYQSAGQEPQPKQITITPQKSPDIQKIMELQEPDNFNETQKSNFTQKSSKSKDSKKEKLSDRKNPFRKDSNKGKINSPPKQYNKQYKEDEEKKLKAKNFSFNQLHSPPKVSEKGIDLGSTQKVHEESPIVKQDKREQRRKELEEEYEELKKQHPSILVSYNSEKEEKESSNLIKNASKGFKESINQEASLKRQKINTQSSRNQQQKQSSNDSLNNPRNPLSFQSKDEISDSKIPNLFYTNLEVDHKKESGPDTGAFPNQQVHIDEFGQYHHKMRLVKNYPPSNFQSSKQSVEDQKEEEEEIDIISEKSKLHILEDQLRKQIRNNPNKALDADLIKQIYEEQAKLANQNNWLNSYTQTDPHKGIQMYENLSADKFKRFFFAVFYTYMMMNVIMAQALPDKKP